MYSAVLFIGIMHCISVKPVVTVERTVFYRERAAGMYSAFPYAFGQVNVYHGNLFRIPFSAVVCCIFLRAEH
jgi:hypothetical protein